MKIRSKPVLCVLTVLLSFVLAAGSAVAADWPDNKPATVVIMYKAGGGTDVMTRAYTKAMEEALGTTVNVVNRPGAIGSLAADFVYAKPADGYWWLGGSQFAKSLRVMGLSTLTPYGDWQWFKIANGIQAFSVKADSPFKTMEDFINAAKKNPGKVSMSNSGIGGIWHEGNEIMTKTAGIDTKQVPYKGGKPAVLAALQGEVDVAGSGLHEVIGHIRSGEMRNLAIFTKEPITLDNGTVLRPITDVFPALASYAPFGSEYTLGVKRDTPTEVLEKIKAAFVAASESPEFNGILEKKFFFKAVTTGEEADRLATLREAVTSWLFWDLKVEGVKVNPADLGIPRPEDFDKWWPPKGYEARLK